jgi:hypothetical protein
MSNHVTIVATCFTNLDEEHDPDGTTYGFRAFDGFDKTYCNSMTEDAARMPDLEFLREIATHHADEILEDMFDYVKSNLTGIEINGTQYEWEQVREILEGK